MFKQKDEFFYGIKVKTSHWSTFCWRCLYFSNILQERDHRIADLFFFLLYDIERSFITLLKICSQKHGYWIWLAYIKHSNSILISWCIIFIFMVITFRTMYNKNQFFYNTHGNYKNINLNILLAKKYKKDLLTYNKSEQKLSWTYNF